MKTIFIEGITVSYTNLREIATLLKLRGFITDEDVTYFPEGQGISLAKQLKIWAIEREQQIRELGYTGGKIEGWATEFKRFGSAYGVVDSDWYDDSQYIYIERYLKITDDINKCKDMTVSQLKSYGVGVTFECKCGNISNILPQNLSLSLDSKPVVSLTGKCTNCSKEQVQVKKVFKPWK